MTEQRKVTIIPADPKLQKKDVRSQHLRVAPYCRVSTDSDEQLSSYEAQIEYYTAKIDAKPNGRWCGSMPMKGSQAHRPKDESSLKS